MPALTRKKKTVERKSRMTKEIMSDTAPYSHASAPSENRGDASSAVAASNPVAQDPRMFAQFEDWWCGFL
jgi:hypothetical protein